MRRYVKFVMGRCGKFYPTAVRTGLKGEDRKYLNNAGQAYGEWAEPEDVHKMLWSDCVITHPETATAYTSYVLDLMAEMEEALGNKEEAETYRQFSNKVKKSYQALREKCPEYTLDTDRQARLVKPLAFNLLNEKQTEYAKESRKGKQ